MAKKIPLLKLLLDKYPDHKKDTLFAWILAGSVKVNSETIKDPKRVFQVGCDIRVSFKNYVSRGGYKLEKALDYWDIDVEGKTVLDAGASTGGFTDCLIKNGAEKVYSVDVGYNQLDWNLRNNPRVVVMEKTNIMNVESLNPVPDFAVCDLSFRSLSGAASKILSLTVEGLLLGLVKPQFENTEAIEAFDGVIKSKSDYRHVLSDVISKLLEEKAFVYDGIASPIKGKKGNQEFLFLIRNEPNPEIIDYKQLIENLIGKSDL